MVSCILTHPVEPAVILAGEASAHSKDLGGGWGGCILTLTAPTYLHYSGCTAVAETQRQSTLKPSSALGCVLASVTLPVVSALLKHSGAISLPGTLDRCMHGVGQLSNTAEREA